MEVQCSPEDVCFEVDGTPEPEPEGSGSLCAPFEVVDERSAVQDEPGVLAHPDLQTPELSGVDAVETEADQVIVVPKGEDTTLLVGLIVGGNGEPAESVAIEATSRVAEEKNLASGVGEEFFGEGEGEGVRSRGHWSERVRRDCVAANCGLSDEDGSDGAFCGQLAGVECLDEGQCDGVAGVEGKGVVGGLDG